MAELKLTFWERVKEWWEEEINKEALFERIFQKNTLYALIVGGASLGIWKVSPEFAEHVPKFLVWIWITWKGIQNEKKKIRKEAAKVLLEEEVS